MSNLLTRREALINVGLAKPGRGKFSNDAKAWLIEQRANGVKFSDDDKPAPKAKSNNTAPVESKPDPRNSEYILNSDLPFPVGEWVAKGDDGNTYNTIQVCNTCRVSLCGHSCLTPTITGKSCKSVSVRLVRRSH